MPKRAYNKLKGREHIQPPQVSKKKKKKLRAKKQVPKPESKVSYAFDYKAIWPENLLLLDLFNSSPQPLPASTGTMISFGPRPSYIIHDELHTMADLKSQAEIAAEKADKIQVLDDCQNDERFREWSLQQALKINDFWKDRLIAAASGQFLEPTDEEIADLVDIHGAAKLFQSSFREVKIQSPEYVTNQAISERAKKTVEILGKIDNGIYKVADDRLRKDSDGFIIVGDCVHCGEPVTLDDEGVDYKHSVDCKGKVRMYACSICAQVDKNTYALVAQPLTLYKAPELRAATILGECKHCHGLLYSYGTTTYHAETKNIQCPNMLNRAEFGEKF